MRYETPGRFVNLAGALSLACWALFSAGCDRSKDAVPVSSSSATGANVAAPAQAEETAAQKAPGASPPATTGALIPAATADIPTTPVKTGGKLEIKSGATTATLKVGAAWATPRAAYGPNMERVSGTSYDIKIVNDEDKDAKPCGQFEILSLGGDGLGVSIGQKGGYVPDGESSFEVPGGVAFVTEVTSGPSKGKRAMARTVERTSKLTIKSVKGNVLTASIDASGYGNVVKGDFVAQICPPR